MTNYREELADEYDGYDYDIDIDAEAADYANEQVRKIAKNNPCAFCEDVDCEGCKYFGK